MYSINMKFLKMNKTCLFGIVIWIILLLCLAFYYKQNAIVRPKYKFSDESHLTEIIWWNSLPPGYQSTRFCGVYVCSFSTRRNSYSQAKAVLFYGSDINVNDLPIPRYPNNLWGLLHEESPRNKPFILHTDALRHFNFSSTFSRYSDQPLTTQYLPEMNDLISPTYFVPIGAKSIMRSKFNLAPVVYLQSDCDTMSGRDEYVKELQRYIRIDSYGLCLHNRDLPKDLTVDYLNKLYSPILLHFLARYKFVIAYENGVCDDYITEKYWRALIIGSIPIYYGSPSIKDWEPNQKSAVYINDFESPKALADFILNLDKNDTEYNSYLTHKYEQLHPIRNKRLLQELYSREFSIDSKDVQLFDSFECYACRLTHEISFEQMKIVTQKHYNCSFPPTFPKMGVLSNPVVSDWENILEVGKCTAKALDSFLQRNQNYTKKEFDESLNRQLLSNQCS